MPKVSIIIPVYNVEQYIRQALDSVVNQTLKDIEIICIDDCSPDNCWNILNEYASKDKRFNIIHLEENKGQGYARNLALDMANGKYIMFLDPDDWLELNACELAYNQIEKNQNDMVFFDTYIYNDQTKQKKHVNLRLTPFKNIINDSQIKFKELNFPFIKTTEIWYKIYSKSFIDNYNIRFEEGRLGEDILFVIKTLCYSNTISIVNKPLYIYRTENSNSSTGKTKSWKDLLYKRHETYIFVKEYGNINILNAKLIHFITSLIYWYNRFTAQDKTIKKDFYNEMRKLFINIDNEYDIKEIRKYIDYKKFKQIVKTPYWKITIQDILSNLIYIKNSNNKRHKVFCLFGIKFKFKRSKH